MAIMTITYSCLKLSISLVPGFFKTGNLLFSHTTMKSILRRFSPAGNYDSLLAAFIGFLIIHAFARHGGIGISPDSVVYLSTAANIHDQGAINDFSGLPIMDFPAFYPIFLSGMMFITGQDTLHFGAVLNGFLFACLIYSCGWMMEHFSFRSKWYKWSLLCFIVLSPCLLEVYSMIWSETLFLLLLLSFIICARRYFLSLSMDRLILLAIVAGLACVTRYAGVTLVGTGGLLILCDGRLRPGKKSGHLFLFAVIAASPLALNLYRNQHVTGTLTGYREKGITSFSQNLHNIGSVFCDWLPFVNDHYQFASLLGSCFILFFAGLFVFRMVRKHHFFSYENIAAAYFIVYAAFILLSATVSRFQQLDSRLLSPLFIPWLWGITSWIPARMPPVSSRWRRVAVAGCLLAGGCFLWGQVNTYRENWEGIRDAGIPGYSEDQWKRSETMDFLRKNKDSLPQGVTLYSNAFEGVWFLTGLHADMIPHRQFKEDIRDMMVEDRFIVIWFDDSENDDLISIPFINQYKHLDWKRRFSDGTVYFFTTDKPATAR
jgi:hypothetical protein